MILRSTLPHIGILGSLRTWDCSHCRTPSANQLTKPLNIPSARVQFLLTGAKCILIIISVSHGSASLKKYCCHNAKEKQKLCTEILLFFGIDNYSTRYSTKKVSENGTHSFFILFLLQFCYDARI